MTLSVDVEGPSKKAKFVRSILNNSTHRSPSQEIKINLSLAIQPALRLAQPFDPKTIHKIRLIHKYPLYTLLYYTIRCGILLYVLGKEFEFRWSTRSYMAYTIVLTADFLRAIRIATASDNLPPPTPPLRG